MYYPLPSGQQWKIIQGGEPLIVSNRSCSVFDIVHVYGSYKEGAPAFDEDLVRQIGHYGMIVTTPVNQMKNSVQNPINLSIMPDARTEAIVTVPAVLLASRHGNPCAARSQQAKGSGYERIDTPVKLQSLVDKIRDHKFRLWSLIQSSDNSLKLTEESL